MPEGPEIKFYYNQFLKGLRNKTLNNIEIKSGKYTRKNIENLNSLKKLLPLRITNTGVKGKNVWIELDKDMSIYFTHGMTGFWNKNDTLKHNHIELLINNEKLYFNDMRGFGNVTVTTSKEELNNKIDNLGLDVMNIKKTDKNKFNNILFTDKNRNKVIGKVLMDQSYLSGIGNYLRAEILWESEISPYRKLSDFTTEDKNKLFNAIIKLVNYHYKNICNHKRAHYPDRYDTFKVYMQYKDILGNTVTREKMDNRTVHWVKDIQK